MCEEYGLVYFYRKNEIEKITIPEDSGTGSCNNYNSDQSLDSSGFASRSLADLFLNQPV